MAYGRLRGAIHASRRARQLHDFTGLRYGTITPTDIDGLIDFHDRAFAFIELKHDGALVGAGQGLSIRRVVDRIELSGARAAMFIADHYVTDPDRQVDAARTLVRAIYTNRIETTYGGELTLRQAIDEWMDGSVIPRSVLPPPKCIHRSEFKERGVCLICASATQHHDLV